MKEWHLNAIIKVYYDLIDGRKKIETRACSPNEEKDYGQIEKGDLLIFYPLDNFSLRIEHDKISFIAGEIRKYSSVEEMLKHENLKDILPDSNSLEDALKVYYSFPRYKERIAKYGIVAIDLLKI